MCTLQYGRWFFIGNIFVIWWRFCDLLIVIKLALERIQLNAAIINTRLCILTTLFLIWCYWYVEKMKEECDPGCEYILFEITEVDSFFSLYEICCIQYWIQKAVEKFSGCYFCCAVIIN